MKLYQKFLTKILLTHRSTLHNADTIYNKKKKNYIRSNYQIHNIKRSIKLDPNSRSLCTCTINIKIQPHRDIFQKCYILHTRTRTNPMLKSVSPYSRSTSKPKSSVHITISGKSPYRIPQKSIVIRRRWWMPRVNLDADQEYLFLPPGLEVIGNSSSATPSLWILDASLIVA